MCNPPHQALDDDQPKREKLSKALLENVINTEIAEKAIRGCYPRWEVHMIEDVAQDAYTLIYQGISSGSIVCTRQYFESGEISSRDLRALLAFSSQVAQRQAHYHHRKQAGRKSVAWDEKCEPSGMAPGFQEVDSNDEVSSTLDQLKSQRHAVVDFARENLDELQKSILIGHLKGATLSEISTKLGTGFNRNTVGLLLRGIVRTIAEFISVLLPSDLIMRLTQYRKHVKRFAENRMRRMKSAAELFVEKIIKFYFRKNRSVNDGLE